MLGIQFATGTIGMRTFGKFVFIGIPTTLVSYLLTWLVWMIPGMKAV